MTPFRIMPVLLCLLLAAGSATAQGNWASYRDTYRTLVVFDKFAGPKHLIEQQLQVASAAPAAQLQVEGKSQQLTLALDATGRTSFPLLKSAYDDNAVLVLPGRAPFRLRARVTVQLRADGVYAVDELRVACEQALGVEQARGAQAGKRCTGVRFVYGPGAQAPLRLRAAAGEAQLPLGHGSAFDGDPDLGLRLATLRFAGAGAGQVLARSAPLAIVPVYE